MSNFALDIRKFVDKANAAMDTVVKKVVFDAAKQIIQMSPVGDPELWGVNINARKEFKVPRAKKDWQLGFVSDESSSFTMSGAGYIGGRFRGNWQIGVGVSPNGTLDVVDNQGDGSKTYSSIQASIPDKAAGNIYYLVNNLPYAQRLEDGWSKQAPIGMVALTVVKWQTIVDEAVNGAYDRESPGPAAGFGAYPL